MIWRRILFIIVAVIAALLVVSLRFRSTSITDLLSRGQADRGVMLIALPSP